MLLHKVKAKDTDGAVPPGPSYMTSKQVGQQPFATYSSLRFAPLTFRFSKASDNMSTNAGSLHDSWTGDFLTDLRQNRPARPGGARPQPSRNAGSTPGPSTISRQSTNGFAPQPQTANADKAIIDSSPQKPISDPSAKHSIGRPIVRQASHCSNTELPSSGMQPYDIPYYERGQRWTEKQEAKTLRAALEAMDAKRDSDIHAAAQDEASSLVWKHQNPGLPYHNPDIPTINHKGSVRPDYKHHLRKGSHARSQSVGPFEQLYITKGGSADGSRSASGSSNQSDLTVSSGSQHSNQSATKRRSMGTLRGITNSIKRRGQSDSSYSASSRSIFGRRHGITTQRLENDDSGNSLNMPDEIHEEPEEMHQDVIFPEPLRIRPKATSQLQGGNRTPAKSQTLPPNQSVSKVEIHKNPPSQSRNAFYFRNPLPPTPPDSANNTDGEFENAAIKHGLEIRGDDIRAATSMKLKDRSPKLPTPTVVSDRPGRPIVSFDHDYKPKQVELKHEEQNHAASGRPEINNLHSVASAPLVPTINVMDALPSEEEHKIIPSINVPEIAVDSADHDIPSISVSDGIPTINVPNSTSIRPLPAPKRNDTTGRPLPKHFPTAPAKSTAHWSPALQPQRAQAQCAACALPISGRIVSAASQRFHPACFTCFHCGTQLECVAFYPEPTAQRSARLARIEARTRGEPLPEDQTHITEQEDGDDSLRFYCHLDFHETFSPRCRSCKTPIEGEVVLACGGEWHVGHFFCAECGDPFEKNTPFVEKDGFAWCVGCHCRRYSGKCAGCRKPITDLVVKALEKEWHEGCFCCKECGGPFDDGRFFTRPGSDIPVCVKCEEKRLKA